MIWLLDVNMLVALGDSGHPQRRAALSFFEHQAVSDGWATCPLTENGFLRILGQPSYPRSVGPPETIRLLLHRLLAAPGHQFWPDELSLADTQLFPHLPGAVQLTDVYLLALAVRKGGRLATFDQRIDTACVAGGAAAYYCIPSI